MFASLVIWNYIFFVILHAHFIQIPLFSAQGLPTILVEQTWSEHVFYPNVIKKGVLFNNCYGDVKQRVISYFILTHQLILLIQIIRCVHGKLLHLCFIYFNSLACKFYWFWVENTVISRPQYSELFYYLLYILYQLVLIEKNCRKYNWGNKTSDIEMTSTVETRI
jgi:hypothetical protein